MKKWMLVLLPFFCYAVQAQTAAISDYCTLGAANSVTSGLKSTNYLQGVIPYCTVTVFLTGTTTKATIYADGNNTPLSNPFTAAADGSWIFHATTNQGYDVQLSGGISPNVYSSSKTITDVFPSADIEAGCGLSEPCTISEGGTDASTASAAIVNLGAAARGANADITTLNALTQINGTGGSTILNMFDSTLTDGNYRSVRVGRDQTSTYDNAAWVFNYVASGSTSNYMGMGIQAAPSIYAFGSGDVAINTTVDSGATFTVNGNTLVDGPISFNSTATAQTTRTNLQVGQAISPLLYGAVCDATWNNSTNTYTGTDDRAAFKTMLTAMAANGQRIVQLPVGQDCRIDPPGGQITSYAVTSNVVTVQMSNSLIAGDIVTPQGLTTGTYLNGVPLVVLSTGLSTSQFEATFYHADVTSTTESAAWGVSPALEFGTSAYQGFVFTGAQGTNGQNGSGYTSIASPMTTSISSGQHATGDSSGPLFQFSYDKSAQITTWSLDGSGNLTITFAAMPGGLTFVAGTGDSIIVGNTGTVDATYHTVATATTTQITITGVSGSAASGSGGLLHQPWTIATFDGVQGAEWDNMTWRSYSRVNPSTCAQAWFNCTFVPGDYGVLDYRGGNMILNNVRITNLQYGFFGVQSDFTHLNNMSYSNGYMGAYVGPDSTPFYVERYTDFGDDVSLWIDGLNYQGINVSNSHFRSGSATTAQIIIANKEYDSTASGGGGIGTTGVYLTGDDFEFGGGCPGTETPTSFISVDYDSSSASPTKDVHIATPTFVNYASSPCNVPDFVRYGHVGTPGYIDIVGMGSTNGTLTNIINYTGTSNTLTAAVLSPVLNSSIATNVATAATGGTVALYTYQGFAPVASPTFTGTVTLGTSTATALELPYTAYTNQILAYFGCMASGTANCLYMETTGSSPYSTGLFAASALFGTIYASFGSNGLHVYNANGGYIQTTGISADPGTYSTGYEWFNTTSLRKKFYDGTSLDIFAWLNDFGCSAAPTGTKSSTTYLTGACTYAGITLSTAQSVTLTTSTASTGFTYFNASSAASGDSVGITGQTNFQGASAAGTGRFIGLKGTATSNVASYLATTLIAGYFQASAASNSALATNGYGLYVDSDTNGAAAIANAYGLYIAQQAGSTAHYGIYQAGTTDTNYFAGPVVAATGRRGAFTCTAAGTITISNTNMTVGSDVTITLETAGGTISTPPAMNSVTAATGFNVLCGAADTSTYRYTIWN